MASLTDDDYAERNLALLRLGFELRRCVSSLKRDRTAYPIAF